MLDCFVSFLTSGAYGFDCRLGRIELAEWQEVTCAGTQTYENPTVHPRDLILRRSSSPSPSPPPSALRTPSPQFYSSFHYNIDASAERSSVCSTAFHRDDMDDSDSNDGSSSYADSADYLAAMSPSVEPLETYAEPSSDVKIIEIPNPLCHHSETDNCNHTPLYKCLCECQCDKSYRRKGDAVRHLNESALPFRCDGCGKGHKRIDARQRHWKRDPFCEEKHSRINANDPKEQKRLARKARKEKQEEEKRREIERRKLKFASKVAPTRPRRRRRN